MNSPAFPASFIQRPFDRLVRRSFPSRLLLTLLVCLIAEMAWAQSPPVRWANAAAGDGSDFAVAIAVDAAGNSFFTGQSQAASVSFGSVAFTNTGPAFTAFVFLVKYDANGNQLWARRVSGTNSSFASGIALDASGNVFVTGQFNTSATFDTIALASAGAFDAFVAKYDGNGNVQWVRNVGGAGQDTGYAVATDATGNCYLAGSFMTNATAGSIVLTAAGNGDIFLAKYDPAGNVLWARQAGGTAADFPKAVAVDRQNNLLICGGFSSTNFVIGGVGLTNRATSDVFLAKYDSNGNLVWAHSSGDTANPSANSLALDTAGNAYVVGNFGGTLTFGITNVAAADSSDAYLAKFDPSGNALWVNAVTSSGFDNARAVAVDGLGAAYVTGQFSGPLLTLDDAQLINTSTNNKSDIYVAKYSSSGTLAWARQFGGTNNDAGYGLGLDASGNAYVCANFQGSTAAFDAFMLAGTTSTHPVVLRLDSGAAITPAPALAIGRSSGSVTVSWPVSAAGFQLESASNTTGPFSWQSVPGAIVAGSNNTVTQPTTNTLRLYRLRK